MRVALKTIAGLYDGATTRELDELSIRTAASFIFEEPEYSRLAARLLSAFVDKEVQGLGVHSFSQSIRQGFDVGLINERVLAFVEANARKLNAAIDATRTHKLEYFGLRTLYDRYLLRHPTRRSVLENPQYFWMRIAVALTPGVHEAIELYSCAPRWTTSPAPRRCSMPARATSSCRAASCSTRPRTPWSRSTIATRMSHCCRSSPAVSALPGIACARKAR